MQILKAFGNLRDRCGLALTAFPQGLRFLAMLLWSAGATLIILVTLAVLGLQEYIDFMSLFVFFATTMFLHSALNRSYELDAEYLASKEATYDEEEEIDELEGR